MPFASEPPPAASPSTIVYNKAVYHQGLFSLGKFLRPPYTPPAKSRLSIQWFKPQENNNENE
jgi:hypothetical protein